MPSRRNHCEGRECMPGNVEQERALKEEWARCWVQSLRLLANLFEKLLGFPAFILTVSRIHDYFIILPGSRMDGDGGQPTGCHAGIDQSYSYTILSPAGMTVVLEEKVWETWEMQSDSSICPPVACRLGNPQTGGWTQVIVFSTPWRSHLYLCLYI